MPPSSAKRKRGNEDSSDDEDTSFGKQILPVANLPENFDGEPMDGLQYLFTVRRDARRLPGVTCVQNPYASAPPTVSRSSHSDFTTHPSVPSEQWCLLLETRFRNLRQNLNQPTRFTGGPHEPGRRLMPEKKERDLWWAFLEGRPETEWNVSSKQSKKKAQGKRSGHGLRAWADESGQEEPTGIVIHESSLLNDEGEVEEALKPDPAELLPTPSGTPAPESTGLADGDDPLTLCPREPSPKLLRLINESTALHLLMYFTHWINNHLQKVDQNVFPPRNSHARWMFALLSRIEDYVSADDMNLLRNLVRACLALLKHIIERELAPSTSRISLVPDAMSKQSCWIIISTVVHVWKQKDLWVDAESILARFPVTAA
ncbi:hypothetical protein FA13DRAFT_1788379 [Coprinellus micaceus]|uniref:Uncharacterized protein n=1 Tax=Coprinellus micaceus TaxID=71717 RepID=A0A4Y7TNK3_COPMI|nr:hypothetical protein FA13DRAFT_1788379 [Coprinellus micaceus]